jgi:hypothetical protein
VVDPSFRKEVTAVEPGALIVGNRVYVQGLSASGRLFVFKREQIQFLWSLQKMKSVQAAALSINQSEEWAERFMNSKKFREYVAHKMDEFSVKNGLTVEWWYQFGKQLTEGKKTVWHAKCVACEGERDLLSYEVESKRNDEMEFEVLCSCGNPMTIKEMVTEMKPTREQVEGWKELGSRLIPKVERVHHQFENVEISFESDSEKTNG